MAELPYLLLRQASGLKSSVSVLVWPGEGVLLELQPGTQKTTDVCSPWLTLDSGPWPSTSLPSKYPILTSQFCHVSTHSNLGLFTN